MTRAAVVAAVGRAAEVTRAWRVVVTPATGTPWDPTQSRDLDAADDAVARLHELAADLGDVL